ncbi:hypothetical protein AVEN_164579-1 [Araneus ventricosus]|uniref:Uncharacterized protein n=1 Tax=Araneus ventricosus TaxID=182803 RepID=A0A4Y2B3M9_ARAVE|nr:hypothetical protein AVEN_164579-1 [Araneus ventricosus]
MASRRQNNYSFILVSNVKYDERWDKGKDIPQSVACPCYTTGNESFNQALWIKSKSIEAGPEWRRVPLLPSCQLAIWVCARKGQTRKEKSKEKKAGVLRI